MDMEGQNSDEPPDKKPKIVQIGGNWRDFGNNRENSVENIGFLGDSNKEEISIEPANCPFEPNQKSEFEIHDDGLMEVTVLQEGSTPGVRTKTPIFLPAGNYTLTVIAYADAETTFFPWVMNSEKVRLTPTVHISTQEEPVSVNFRIDEDSKLTIGVLCHRQEIGDKCYISSLHISRTKLSLPPSSGNFHSISHSDFIPHQNTTLELTENGTIVRSKPISTPGTFALVEVKPSSVMTLFTRVSVKFPSIAFLYVADADSGSELIKRDVIFESKEDSEFGEQTELFSSFDIPSGTSQIRVGILFSTVTEPEEHVMMIHNLEVTVFHRLNDFTDETYVLSLEKEKAKFELCRRQGDRYGIELTRWEAIDGESAEVYDNWLEYMEKPWSRFDESLGRKAIDKPGAWGYLLTMKSIFQDAILKGHDSIAVFDDDFIISKSFDHRFSKLVEIIGEDWDVIYLGASQWLWDNIEITDLPYYQPDENTNGTFAVIYRKTVFSEIIANIEQMDSPFDAGPIRSVVLGPSSGKSFVAHPNLVIANLEKPGIRDSRNQIEFSKRFGWDLAEFPPWFTRWNMLPSIMRDSPPSSSEGVVKFVTAVTTIDRKEYLEQFIDDWVKTKNKDAESILVVADDGSTDGTRDWLCEELSIEDSRLVVIGNDGLGIARQTNSILDFVGKMKNPPDAIFMCNDDIRFLKSGWDDAYYSAMSESGFDHLVYFNPEWKPPSHSIDSPRFERLLSSCTPREAMGCFYTLTPELIEKIGYFDEQSFPVRGHSHVDYTLRACRSEANDSQFLYDIIDSNQYIGMVLREGYRRTHRILSVKERISTTSADSLVMREEILLNEMRSFVPRGWKQ